MPSRKAGRDRPIYVVERPHRHADHPPRGLAVAVRAGRRPVVPHPMVAAVVGAELEAAGAAAIAERHRVELEAVVQAVEADVRREEREVHRIGLDGDAAGHEATRHRLEADQPDVGADVHERGGSQG
jgi:outer membrane murein-binding lipoprotein Lpp